MQHGAQLGVAQPVGAHGLELAGRQPAHRLGLEHDEAQLGAVVQTLGEGLLGSELGLGSGSGSGFGLRLGSGFGLRLGLGLGLGLCSRLARACASAPARWTLGLLCTARHTRTHASYALAFIASCRARSLASASSFSASRFRRSTAA